MEPLLVGIGLLFVAMGVVGIVQPERLVQLAVWKTKLVMKAKLVPTKGTYTFFRFIGVLYLLIGVGLFLIPYS